MCYLALPLYICGFVVIGAALQKHLTIGALVGSSNFKGETVVNISRLDHGMGYR